MKRVMDIKKIKKLSLAMGMISQVDPNISKVSLMNSKFVSEKVLVIKY